MKTLSTLLLLALLSGCSSQPSSGSLITSTSPLPPGVRGTIPAKGGDCQYRLLGLLPINSSATMADALADAKANAQSSVLTDVTVDHNSGFYFLFSNSCIRIQGLGVPEAVLRRVNQQYLGDSFR